MWLSFHLERKPPRPTDKVALTSPSEANQTHTLWVGLLAFAVTMLLLLPAFHVMSSVALLRGGILATD